MKNLIFMIAAAVLFFLFCSFNSFAQDNLYTISKENSVSQQASISFILHTDKTYNNGRPEQEFTQTLIELSGLGSCILQKSISDILIYFQWENEEIHNGFYIKLTDLPGPQKYVFQFTWDAEKGLLDGYMNGISFRMENTDYYKPWEVKGSATEFNVPSGPNRVTDVKVLSRYMPKNEAVKQVPKSLVGKMAHLLRLQSLPSPKDISKRKSKLLYSSPMNSKSSVKDWILEGPAEIRFEDNKMIMSSQIPNPPDGSTGHFNFWCPADFPENIIVEWDCNLPIIHLGISNSVCM